MSDCFKLPPLPWPKNALEPFISERTIEFHYGKHHAGYVKTLNEIASKNEGVRMDIEDLIRSSSFDMPTLNNSGQVWTHTFFWNSMVPAKEAGRQRPEGDLLQLIQKCFGGVEQLKEQFIQAGACHFGSGYVWLVVAPGRQGMELKVITTHDAGNPLREGTGKPLLTCDLWEHSYYLDVQNEKKKYLEQWFHLVNWGFVAANLQAQPQAITQHGARMGGMGAAAGVPVPAISGMSLL